MEFESIMELLVLGAIALELFALYNHTKIDNRIDEHILDTERKLEKYDVLVQVLNNNMSNLDEHLTRMGEQINNLDKHMNNLDEHMIRYDAHMTQYSNHINKLDDHMNRYDRSLDEHMNRLDDLLWKSSIQNIFSNTF